ncbi:hypothetical protein ES703_47168 [subsurface metagenome]
MKPLEALLEVRACNINALGVVSYPQRLKQRAGDLTDRLDWLTVSHTLPFVFKPTLDSLRHSPLHDPCPGRYLNLGTTEISQYRRFMSLRLSRKRPFFFRIQKKALSPITPRGISMSLQPKESLIKMIDGLFIGLYGHRDLILICMAMQRDPRRSGDPASSPDHARSWRSPGKNHVSEDNIYNIPTPANPHGLPVYHIFRHGYFRGDIPSAASSM